MGKGRIASTDFKASKGVHGRISQNSRERPLDHIVKWRHHRAEINTPTTINIEHRHLKAMFNFALDRHWIPENFWAKTKPLRTDKKIPQTIPKAHLKQFFKVIENLKYSHEFYLCTQKGLA